MTTAPPPRLKAKNKSLVLLTPAAVAFVLGLTAACSGAAEPAPTVTVTETAPAPDPAASAEEMESQEDQGIGTAPTEEPVEDKAEYKSHGESPRGNIIKHIGDWAGIMDDTGQNAAVDFRITAIETDPSCDSEFSGRPENDNFVRLEFEIITYSGLKEIGDFWLSEYDFSAYKVDGSRINNPQGNGWACLAAKDSLPSDIGPGEKVSGSIVLDLPQSAGFVGFSSYMTDGGWEWPLQEADGI